MSKTNDFVSLLLKARSMTHVAHWATPSYAQHMALGAFYEAITGLMDAFVEQYQGYSGKRLAPAIEAAKVRDIADQLEDDVEWIERNRYEICERDETSMQNTIDEVVALYHTTLYKLRMLK
jgi:hypothetical protein